jgi:hypothetical protein
MDLEEWKAATGRLRVSAVFRCLLILLGVLFVQFVAAILCMLGLFLQRVATGQTIQEIFLSVQTIVVGNSADFSMAISLLYALIVIVWCGVLYRRWQWRVKPDYRKALAKKRLFGIVCLGFGTCIVMTILLSIVSMLFPALFENYNSLMKNLDVDSSILTVPYVVLLGPVAEELVFRGVMMDRLKPAFSFWTANIIQAALFGVFHLNVIQGVYAFCLGLVLGLVVQVTGTILASVMTHILFNGTTEVISLIPAKALQSYAGVEIAVVILAVAACAWGLKYYLGQGKMQDFQGGI